MTEDRTGQPAAAAAEHGERIAELDGMRGVAIALVIALHAFIQPHVVFWESLFGGPFVALLRMAFCGVDVFFVLSGFLIGGIVLERRGSSGFYPAFYARRTTRIMPPYYLLVLLAFLPFGVYGVQASEGAVPLIGYLTFTANLYTSAGAPPANWLAPLWSICIEEQFYLFAPLVLRAVRARWIPWLLGTVIVASAGLRTAMLTGAVALSLSPWDLSLTRLDGLAFGVLAAWIVRQPAAVRWGASRLRLLSVAFVLLLLGCVLFSQVSHAMLVGPGLACVSATAFAALLVLRFHPESRLSRCLRVRPLVFLGRYSYFLYLFHAPWLWLAHRFIGSTARSGPVTLIALEALAMILLCGVAVVSWLVFEAPLLALGRRVRYGPDAGATSGGRELAAPQS